MLMSQQDWVQLMTEGSMQRSHVCSRCCGQQPHSESVGISRTAQVVSSVSFTATTGCCLAPSNTGTTAKYSVILAAACGPCVHLVVPWLLYKGMAGVGCMHQQTCAHSIKVKGACAGRAGHRCSTSTPCCCRPALTCLGRCCRWAVVEPDDCQGRVQGQAQV
jgi:hypothetical protein